MTVNGSRYTFSGFKRRGSSERQATFFSTSDEGFSQ
jgi:hypothetical protein